MASTWTPRRANCIPVFDTHPPGRSNSRSHFAKLPRVCVYVYVCMHVCMYVCACMCVRMYGCMCACVCMYGCMCMCVYVYVYKQNRAQDTITGLYEGESKDEFAVKVRVMSRARWR